MEFLEQYADSVVSYSSRYNSTYSFSYSPDNLTGKARKYPQYGDFADTFMLRTYGKWWRESEAIQPNYMPQDSWEIESEDFVVVKYEFPVVPTKVIIYETYNPGAVVRLYGRLTGCDWHLLYETYPERPETIPKNAARCFTPPLRRIKKIINELRIELNQSLLTNCTGLDAVLLAGYRPLSKIQLYLLTDGLEKTPGPNLKSKQSCTDLSMAEGQVNYFEMLPYEIILHIFKFLDLKSLFRCAIVNQMFYQVTLDPTIYKALALKKYWMKVDNKTLKFFQRRCTMLKKIDLSWCGNNCMITEDFFQDFLRTSGTQLTHLSVGSCDFIRNVSLGAMAKCPHLVDLRLNNCQPSSWTFTLLSELQKLQSLDLCGTNICSDSLIKILKANPHLRHLIIDHCQNLSQVDDIFETLSNYNPKLVALSAWKVRTATPRGIQFLSRCHQLRELDVGWVLVLAETSNCLERIAHGCKDLRRLIISNWRNLTDHELLPIITTCKNLHQLDLLGIRNISPELVGYALASLPHLKLLDISFCSKITMDEVMLWSRLYPMVIILRHLDDGFIY